MNGLELPFIKDDGSLDEHDRADSDSKSNISNSSSLYFNTYRRAYSYSLPLLIDKVFVSEADLIAKYYYFYPDFPERVLVRCAKKLIPQSLQEIEPNAKPCKEESKDKAEEIKDQVEETKDQDEEPIEASEHHQESRYEWRYTTDFLQLYINSFNKNSEFEHYIICHSLLRPVVNQNDKPEIPDFRDVEIGFNEQGKPDIQNEGLENQLKYLKSLFDNLHNFLIQVLYPKLKMELKEAGQEEKVALYENVMKTNNLRDFSKEFLQYIRKICFPKGVYYWKGIGMNKKIWGPRSTYVAAKEYIQAADTFTKVLTSVLILKSTLDLAFDS